MKKSRQNEYNTGNRFNTFLNKEFLECKTDAEREAVKEAMGMNTARGAIITAEIELSRKKPRKPSARKWIKYNDEVRNEIIRVLNSPNAPTQRELGDLTGVPRRRISEWWMEAVRKGEVEYKQRNIREGTKEEHGMKSELLKREAIEFVDGDVPQVNQFSLSEDELLLLWCNVETQLKPEFIEKADNILAGKILGQLYRQYGGSKAAYYVARDKGWV